MHSVVHSLAVIRVISRDVFRLASKERLMYGFLILSVLFVLLTNIPFMNPDLFEDMPPKIASLQIGFSGINIFLMLMCVFIGLNVLQDMCSDTNLALLLSKPVQRWHIIEGICFGLFKIIFLNWLIMVSSLWMIVYFHTHELNGAIWLGMSVSLVLSLMYISMLIFFYIFVPNAISGILTIFIIIASFGAVKTKEQLVFFPKMIAFFATIGVEVIPKVNSLFGVSMNTLGIFDLRINAAPIFFHSVVFLMVLHIVSHCRFSRPK